MNVTMKKKKYLKPDSNALPAFQSSLMAGSVRKDGTTIIHDGTDDRDIDEGDGDDAGAKYQPFVLWENDSTEEEEC